MLAFRLLGTLEVRDAEGCLVLARRRKQRALLALLLLRAGSSVSLDEIVDALWGTHPPASARANLQSYVASLRRLLGDVAPADTTRPVWTVGGYRLDLQPGECDIAVFEALAAAGTRALEHGRYAEAAERLARALGLWRGPLLEDLADFDWVGPHATRWDEARLRAVEAQVDARLSLGQYAELAVELSSLTIEHPTRERLWGQYMLALERAGRRPEALRAYERVCAVLRAELGVEPGPALNALHRSIRDGARSHGAGPVRVADPAPEGPGAAWEPARLTPALLPPAVPDFTGRQAELRRLRELVQPGAGVPSVGLTVVGITGMAGVGKTTLAVHLAHTMAPAHPDGQLYADLGGAESAPLNPAEVLGRFLRALGVPSPAVPADPAERMELYRSLLARRRVLVLLDNAASEQQIRPLLPGAATCTVLITSRSRLTGVEGARWVALDVLSDCEAACLLARLVDDERVAASPEDATTIARMCGGLPLAVRIAGARLTARPGWRLANLVSLLRDEHRRLDGLHMGDLEVRASLALSYDGLEPSARRLFRLLGRFDVASFAGWLAVVVAGVPRDEAARDLETLVDAHLLTVAGTDAVGQVRYRFHDLVRIFARDLAGAHDDPAELSAALRRGFGGWLSIADRFEPGMPGPCYARITGATPRPPVHWVLDELPDAQPLAWFDAERDAVLSAIRQACDAGHDELAFDLAARMEKYFDVRGMYAEWAGTNRLVMAACRESGNRRGEAVMFRGLVDVSTWIATDQGTEAMTRSHADAVRLLEMFTAIDEPGGMADAAVMRSWALTAMGRPDEAIDAATQALRWAERCGHLGGQTRAHVALAVAHGERSSLEAAFGHLHAALPPARELGNPRHEASVLQFLGIAHREAGQFDLSERLLDESLAISRRHDDTYTTVLTAMALARLYLCRSDPRARSTAETALAMAREYRMTHHVAESLGVLGEIELAAGQPALAVGYLRESVAVWRTRGWVRFQAAALTMLGRALTGLDPAAAHDALEEAHQLFTRVGDTAKADSVADLLERCRGASGTPAASGVG